MRSILEVEEEKKKQGVTVVGKREVVVPRRMRVRWDSRKFMNWIQSKSKGDAGSAVGLGAVAERRGTLNSFQGWW